jgi:hypothetical protein
MDCGSRKYYFKHIIITEVEVIRIEYVVFNVSLAETTLVSILLIAGSPLMYLLFHTEQTDFKPLKAGNVHSRKPQ